MYRDAQPKTIYLKDYQLPAFLIDKTDLLVELNEAQTRVTSTICLRRNPDYADSQVLLVLHGIDLQINSLSIDDEILAETEYTVSGETLTILRSVPEIFVFKADVTIKPEQNTSLEGLYKSRSMYCTQCEAEGFRKITFYLDRPDVMAKFTTTINADKSLYPILLSNGNPVARGEDENGRHWVTWHDPFKKPAYLFAMVAGDLAVLEDNFVTCSGRNVALQIFVEEKDIDKCSFAMTSLKQSMAWDEETYGREYDLDIFMIVAVDDFNAGAMENKGLNIFNTSAVLAKQQITTDNTFQNIQAIVAHEYFHNWSGNRVTCRDWFQLSLKEGFTVFRDSQFSADMGSPTVKRVQDVNFLRTLQFAEDAGPMAHPVQPGSFMEIANFYTLTVYEKGAEVVRMFHTLLGAELFRRGSDLYFQRNDGRAVSIEDFVDAMTTVSGRDFSQFMNWYRQAGTPQLDISSQYDETAKTYTLTFKQSCRPTAECQHKKPYLIPIAMGLVAVGEDIPLYSEGINGVTETVIELTQPEQTVVFTQVENKPVPSLLRGFSAPVRWHYDYSRDEFLYLMSYDSDGYNRWEALNQLAVSILNEMIDAILDGKTAECDQRLIEAFRRVLADKNMDKAMAALMLGLPTEAYLSEGRDIIDTGAIHQVRLMVRQTLASALKSEFLQIFNKNKVDEPYQPEPLQIARRSLKNSALAYLSLLDDPECQALVYSQACSADNMTDTHSALVALVNTPVTTASSMAQKALQSFYTRFSNESLAVNLWFQVQAGIMLPGGLERVKTLMGHKAFDINNPNKVRSLIGVFCNSNAVSFHRDDGAGYRFLADNILVLNTLNPQIASRLLTPLTRWRKYPVARAMLMKAELQRILAHPTLSTEVYEVASKSLIESSAG